MKVMLTPVVNSTGNRKNNGPVTLVVKQSHVDKATGRMIPTQRIKVGHEPVDVSAAMNDPMLEHYVKSGKLVKATQETVEAAEEAAEVSRGPTPPKKSGKSKGKKEK